MARNELCISIPSYFKCPISMEVMKSPVSLSTGVTYDRSSIQSWLESGHTTCPATMQPLSSPSFVPNLTLLRLMQIWPSLLPPSPRAHLSNNGSLHSLKKFLNQANSSDEYCRVIVNSKELLQSLTKLHDQAKESEEFCRVLVNSEDFFDSIVKLITWFDNVTGKLENLELMLVLMGLVVSYVQVKCNKLINCLPKFVYALQNGSIQAKFSTAKILQKILNDDGETKRIVMETPRLIPNAYNLLRCDDDLAIEAGLSLLITLAGSSRTAKKELLRLGLVKRVAEIMCNTQRSSNKLVIERSMEALEMMATCSEGRKKISEEEMCVEEMVKRLMKVSAKTTEHGVTVLWSVCYMFKDEKVVDIVRRCNGVGKFLVLLQSDCKPIVKQMCGDLVKVLRGSEMSCCASYNTKTTHIMPF